MMHFWLNHCDGNHVELIPTAIENIDYIFHLTSQIMEADRLHLFSLAGGPRIDEDEYLSSLEDGTELIVCTEEEIQKIVDLF